MASVTNSSHYGIAGYWATMASREGLIGITGTNARASIAPTFGVDNMMGTNPLTFAFPTDEDFPFCLDCATSIVQRGRIEYYARSGKSTPAGTVISQDGEAMTDSAAILKALTAGTAALAPLGGIGEELAGYKGYGYAAVVEILSAALAGGLFMKDLTNKDENGSKRPYHLGHFFIAIDPEAFMGLETFKKRQATSFVLCVHPRKHLDMTASIQQARRNGMYGWSARTRAYRWAKLSRKISRQSAICTSSRIHSHLKNN